MADSDSGDSGSSSGSGGSADGRKRRKVPAAPASPPPAALQKPAGLTQEVPTDESTSQHLHMLSDLASRKVLEHQSIFMQMALQQAAGAGSMFHNHSGMVSPMISPSPSPRNSPSPTTALTWKEYCPLTWVNVFDNNGKPRRTLTFTGSVDKGFTYSAVDRSFVCQKKNHFQVTTNMESSAGMFARKDPSGPLLPVTNPLITIQGIECNTSGERQTRKTVKIEQSNRVERTKHELAPTAAVCSASAGLHKLTIPRLHFSKTTSNNIRRHGKPNPKQQHFALVLSLVGTVGGTRVCLCALESDRIIVRASNLNIFNETTQHSNQWSASSVPHSIHYNGNVGINTDAPTEALSVNGNVIVSGRVLQPSDRRLKENIQALDRKQQLRRLRQVKLYRYTLKDEWSSVAGRADHPNEEVGVLAQELHQIIPDAVRRRSTATVLGDGTSIPDLMVVDKERLFMEAVGAVQELSDIADSLRCRIKTLELESEKIRATSALAMAGSSSSSTVASCSSSEAAPPSLLRRAAGCAAITAIIIMVVVLLCVVAPLVLHHHKQPLCPRLWDA